MRSLSVKVVKVAAQHQNELLGIFQRVDADETGITVQFYVFEGEGLDGRGPFQVPPEVGFKAVSSRGSEARVTVRSPEGNPWD